MWSTREGIVSGEVVICVAGYNNRCLRPKRFSPARSLCICEVALWGRGSYRGCLDANDYFTVGEGCRWCPVPGLRVGNEIYFEAQIVSWQSRTTFACRPKN
jgi:hypothetical protein